MSIRLLAIAFASGLSLSLALSAAHAAPITQYASSVIGFSSEYNATGSWSAEQVLGAPDTGGYGDIGTAWAPSRINGTLEYITVGFSTAVYATGATVRETYGNGFVYQIDALDVSGQLHTVWSGSDPSLPGTPVDFTVSWDETAYLVRGLKIYTNTDHNPSTWEEIDAIQLAGLAPATVPEPGTAALIGLGLLGFAASRRKSAAVRPPQ